MKKVSAQDIMTIPNCITSVRILGTVVLLFIIPLTPVFFIIYTLCGLTDVLDGWIARHTNSVSSIGSRLDSIADILLYAVAIIKILPILWRTLPFWIWYIVGGIVILRIASYIIAAIKFHRFSSMHTKMNKISGAAVFLIPYSLLVSYVTPYCIVVCAIASVATVQELILHLCRKNYQENRKGLL